jgi:hypothetical protein
MLSVANKLTMLWFDMLNVVLFSVDMLNVVLLSVDMLNVVLLSVVAPYTKGLYQLSSVVCHCVCHC